MAYPVWTARLQLQMLKNDMRPLQLCDQNILLGEVNSCCWSNQSLSLCNMAVYIHSLAQILFLAIEYLHAKSSSQGLLVMCWYAKLCPMLLLLFSERVS